MPPPDTLRLVYWLCLVIYPIFVIISSLVIITLVWTFKGELNRRWQAWHSPRTSQQHTLWLPTSACETPAEVAASSPDLSPSCAVESATGFQLHRYQGSERDGRWFSTGAPDRRGRAGHHHPRPVAPPHRSKAAEASTSIWKEEEA
jgi:hypothetical protein